MFADISPHQFLQKLKILQTGPPPPILQKVFGELDTPKIAKKKKFWALLWSGATGHVVST